MGSKEQNRRLVDSAYLEELERTKAQLILIGRSMGTLYHQSRKQSAEMERLMQELHASYLSIVETLARTVEAHDDYTRNHLERCREFGTALAHEVDGSLVTPDLEYGFLLHDVGKIGVPDAILVKPGPLSPEEMRLMQTHPINGIHMVTPLRRFLGESAIEVIRHHHERFDGKGYPDGLKGGEIPVPARIFTVVDSFDAMTSDRPYRKALTLDEAIDRLRRGSGTQFDPDVVAAFTGILDRLPA